MPIDGDMDFADLQDEGTTASADDAGFGTLSAERPQDADQRREKFRIAILGDFSGRANRGQIDIGDALADRKPVKLDIDNIDEVVARFATTLVLPIGKDDAAVEVQLDSLDDLHPDEIYENVELFEELSDLRDLVARGDRSALADLEDWAESHGSAPARGRRASGSAVPADRRLRDFRALVDARRGQTASGSATEDLIARIVGPYIQAAPAEDRDKILASVDRSISGAMRTILHHPDFQAVEATWRSLDFLARRIETGPRLEIVLYDVSAEEWAADLAADDDLSTSGLFRILAEEPRLDASQGPISAVFGLYTLEETPPHAELMGRMAKIAAWMNAPFMAAMSPAFLDTKIEDRHPLVAQAWDALRNLPEASHTGLASPRFLLRLPYGSKTDPVDAFDFEEFTLRDGLKGMLWANPVILSATLMAVTAQKMGAEMRLGEIMSLGDIPVHTMTDPHGDQVALPCTERLLNTRTMADVVARGFMPVLSIKGRNEVRQGSFQALGAGLLAGPWALTAGQAPAGHRTDLSFAAAVPGDATKTAHDDQPTGSDAENEDAGEFDFDGLDDSDDEDAFSFDTEGSDDAGDLDDLLAGFGDDAESEDDNQAEVDPDLAALLEDF